MQANRERQVIGEVEIDLKELSNDHFRWMDEMNDKYDGKCKRIAMMYLTSLIFLP